MAAPFFALEPNISLYVSEIRAQFPAAGVPLLTGVGAIRRFLAGFWVSSRSDSLMPPDSLLPSVLPLTELAVLMLAIGVIGGVDNGRPPIDGLAAATLGTVPRVGVGFVAIIPVAVCINDDCVATDDAEFELVGLAGRPAGAEGAGTVEAPGTLATLGVDAAVGVGTGEGWAELETDIAREG